MAATYLVCIHFKLADDLDGDFTLFPGAIFCAIDVAECTVSHFFQQYPAFQAGVPRHLRLALALFGHDLLYLSLMGTGCFLVRSPLGGGCLGAFGLLTLVLDGI